MFPFLQRIFTIHIDFPALDRLLNFLEANQQQKIDAYAAQVKSATDGLKNSTSGLQQAVQNTGAVNAS